VTPGEAPTPASTEAGQAILAAARDIVAAAAAEDAQFDGAELVTIGWATVDLGRAERELGQALGVSSTRDPPRGRAGSAQRRGSRIRLARAPPWSCWSRTRKGCSPRSWRVTAKAWSSLSCEPVGCTS